MQQTFTTEFGTFAIEADRDVKIAHVFKTDGSHQKKDVDLLRRFIGKNDIVADIGAHVGTFSVPLSRIAKKVYSFEPMPGTFALLKENIVANKADNIVPINCAVSDKEETLVAKESPNRAGTMFFTEGQTGASASAKTLDKAISKYEKISLIKIDVEGMEHSVFKGSKRIIHSDRPYIFFEVNTPALTAHKKTRGDLEKFLRKENYVLFRNSERKTKEPELAKIFTIYQGYFFDCFAVPKEKVTFTYMSAPRFLLSQVMRKIKRAFRF